MNARRLDRVATAVLWAAALLILFVLGWLLFYILRLGLPAISWHFLTARPSEIQAGGGVGPQLFNTFYLLILSLVFSVPVGLGAGIYLAEYARPGWLTDLIRLGTESLASVPSIVLGLFGMILFVQAFHLGFTIIGGALTLALLNLPVLVRVAEESLRAVPVAYREASLALGATRYQTIVRAVLPAALPGLVTGVILAAGKALGETAILIFTAGVTTSRYLPDFNPLASGETLAVHIWALQSNPIVSDWRLQANGAAALLVLVILLFNLAVAVPARVLHRRLTGDGHR